MEQNFQIQNLIFLINKDSDEITSNNPIIEIISANNVILLIFSLHMKLLTSIIVRLLLNLFFKFKK